MTKELAKNIRASGNGIYVSKTTDYTTAWPDRMFSQ